MLVELSTNQRQLICEVFACHRFRVMRVEVFCAGEHSHIEYFDNRFQYEEIRIKEYLQQECAESLREQHLAVRRYICEHREWRQSRGYHEARQYFKGISDVWMMDTKWWIGNIWCWCLFVTIRSVSSESTRTTIRCLSFTYAFRRGQNSIEYLWLYYWAYVCSRR